MQDGQVLLLEITATGTGQNALRVTLQEPSGTLCEEQIVGGELDIREQARRLAARHDLVPIWYDDTWLRERRPRPPACRYERRTV